MNKRPIAIFASISLAAAAYAAPVTWPAPPPGYAYDTDLKPHSTVLTNAPAAGIITLKQADDLYLRTYLPETPEYYAQKTYHDYYGLHLAMYYPSGNVKKISITPHSIKMPDGDYSVFISNSDAPGFWVGRPKYNPGALDGCWGYGIGCIYTPSLGAIKIPDIMSYDDSFALKSDIATAKTEINALVTNVVRDVQGLVYDEKLGITWKQTMYDGNLYYIAVTNANITEVK